MGDITTPASAEYEPGNALELGGAFEPRWRPPPLQLLSPKLARYPSDSSMPAVTYSPAGCALYEGIRPRLERRVGCVLVGTAGGIGSPPAALAQALSALTTPPPTCATRHCAWYARFVLRVMSDMSCGLCRWKYWCA